MHFLRKGYLTQSDNLPSLQDTYIYKVTLLHTLMMNFPQTSNLSHRHITRDGNTIIHPHVCYG